MPPGNTNKIVETENDELRNLAWRSFADTYRTVYSYVNSDLRQYGLTPPQYTVLRIVGTSKNGSATMTEIGKEMIVTFANVTTVVDNLDKRGLVRRERSTQDRRVVNVRTTEKGLELFQGIRASHRKEISKLLESLSKKEIEELLRLTEKIKTNVPRPNIHQ